MNYYDFDNDSSQASNPSRQSEGIEPEPSNVYTANTEFWRPNLEPGTAPQPQASEGAPAQTQPQAQPAPQGRPQQPLPQASPAEAPNAEAEEHLTLGKVFGDGRWRIFFGVFLMLAAVYMLIASISAITSGAADQSIVQNQSATAVASSHSGVENNAGWFGAFLSHLIMYKWLGLGGFIIIFYILALGVSLVNLHKFKFWSLTFKTLVSAISVSIIGGLISYMIPSHALLGGVHGRYINELLIDNASIFAAIGLSILMVTALVLIFLKPVKKVISLTREMWKKEKDSLEKRYYAGRQSAQTPQPVDAENIPAAEATDPQSPEQMPETASETTAEPATGIATEVNVVDANSPGDVTVVTGDALDNYHDTFQAEVMDMPLDVTVLEDSTVPEVMESDLTDEDIAVVPAVGSDNPLSDTGDIEIVTEVPAIEEAETFDTDAYDPTAELSHYRFPSLDLLTDRRDDEPPVDEAEQEENRENIRRSLQSYGVEIASIRSTVGPTITLYEIVPADGVRISKIKRLGDDMAMSLAAIGIRIIAPMPGKGTIGMEVPNKRARVVSIRSILSSKAYHESTAELPVAMGVTIENKVYIADLAKMPHLLVAGATGMGKSVGLNTILASIIFKKHPAEVKFVLVDPKMVEFSLYRCLERHFLAKLPDEEQAIITDPLKVVSTLRSLCIEMDRRYELLSQAGVRGLKEYNLKFISRRLNPEKGHRYLPYIVVVIDEFADLILTAGKEVETPISRIAAKARAVGIHMILATQRPSVNVITGTIKANFPSRMAFRVTQMNDSRTIIDRPGAEQLVGRGDMLISRDGIIDRVQCALIDTDEVERICDTIASQQGYPSAYELPEDVSDDAGRPANESIDEIDSLFETAGFQVISAGQASTTGLQRSLNVGYPRAGRIMDQLCQYGVVGPANGAKMRSVLMDATDFKQLLDTLNV